MFDKLNDKMFELNENHSGLIETLMLLLGTSTLGLVCGIANSMAHSRGYQEGCDDTISEISQTLESEKEESDS